MIVLSIFLLLLYFYLVCIISITNTLPTSLPQNLTPLQYGTHLKTENEVKGKGPIGSGFGYTISNFSLIKLCAKQLPIAPLSPFYLHIKI